MAAAAAAFEGFVVRESRNLSGSAACRLHLAAHGGHRNAHLEHFGKFGHTRLRPNATPVAAAAAGSLPSPQWQLQLYLREVGVYVLPA